MANNDSVLIPYVIQEGSLWYVAYKEKNPFVPEITVSAKGIANHMSEEINDGYDFGPDTYNPSVTSGVPLTQTSGLQEAVNYQQTNGGEIKMLGGVFTISANVPLKEVNTSNFLGVKEYAIIPIEGVTQGSGQLPSFNLSGIGGLISSGGTTQSSLSLDYDVSQLSIIDVSQVSNLPSGASVVLFAWDKSVNTGATGIVNMHDFAIFQAVPASSGDNIVGGFDFETSFNSNVRNISIYSPNNFFETVFPADTVIGGIIDAVFGDTCWVDNIAVYCNYYGFILGPHTHGGTVILNSCYYGITPMGTHGVDISRLDIVGCINNIYISVIASIRIFLLDGEDYSAQSSAANQTNADVLVNSGISGDYPVTTILNFHMDFSNGSPNPRLPKVINNSSTTYEVNINAIGIESTKRTTVSGTTAGSFVASMPQQDNTYKKVIIYLDAYENDSTTAQTYTFPVAFSTVAVITTNSASVPVVSTSLTEFSIAPDTTTAYTGIIVIEGY
jgi:hypothetical protein